MCPIEWSESLSLGIPSIDAEHRQIFNLAANLSSSGSQVGVMKSLAMLCNYVNIHFRDEETAMAIGSYPRLDEHIQQHTCFREALFALLEDAKEMSLDQLADELHRLVNDWLHNHVLTADAEYHQYLSSLTTTDD